ncbi:GMC family oxidoreductase [Pseudorhodoferax sp.]|uniref:GMC family oxidoreductase n=1 Tax=Pseudorhodoferax sp. TaxID=1993553 RepID=UPI002DD688DB|nr:GMC family oxidoreductase N-terminal domain-containing protein [Pseudorhodoferax sp.]
MDYDYIVVGAGSAGCTLAYRLGEDADLRILVLEAGGADRSPILRVPLTWGLILKHRMFDWGYFTEPEPGLDGRRIECARGKVLGGCTSVNGMAYARGAREDYDHWAFGLGLRGWSYQEVLPYFRRSESWEDGASALRGGEGPLTVTRLLYDDPLVEAFLKACDRAGHARNADYNGASAEGFGPMQATIRRGLRWSAASAYLRPAVARGNVTVQTGTLVRRVVFAGDRATGVELVENGRRRTVHARREVLLAGGVVNSPQLLMLSGVGDPAQLRRHGIAVQAELPGVGRNLHDHLVCDVRWRRNGNGPLHRALRLDRIAVDLLRTWLHGSGQSSRVPAAAVGLVRSQPQLRLPDVQMILAAAPMTAGPHLAPLLPAYTDAFGIKGVFLTPESRGEVTLASADPAQHAVIRQNFLATQGDRVAMREMVRRMREIGAQAPLQPFIAEELAPGAGQTNDAQIDAFVRRTAITLHHPVGTCRMGMDGDAQAVLDTQLRVRGLRGLRVVDGSAMPCVVRGPTNAPIIMMAEKAADLLRGRAAPALPDRRKPAVATPQPPPAAPPRPAGAVPEPAAHAH